MAGGRGRWSGCQGTEGVTGMGWVREGWQEGGVGEMVRVPGDRGGDRDGMGGGRISRGGWDGRGQGNCLEMVRVPGGPMERGGSVSLQMVRLLEG